jgi:hypothetical protein
MHTGEPGSRPDDPDDDRVLEAAQTPGTAVIVSGITTSPAGHATNGPCLCDEGVQAPIVPVVGASAEAPRGTEPTKVDVQGGSRGRRRQPAQKFVTGVSENSLACR